MRYPGGVGIPGSYLLGLQLAQGWGRAAHDRDQQARGVLPARELRMCLLLTRHQPASPCKRASGDRDRDTLLPHNKDLRTGNRTMNALRFSGRLSVIVTTCSSRL